MFTTLLTFIQFKEIQKKIRAIQKSLNRIMKTFRSDVEEMIQNDAVYISQYTIS
jgi:hypothetical protein